MKLVMPLLAVAALAGCASNQIPEAKDLTSDLHYVHQMTREEVIAATKECEDNDMRALVQYMQFKSGTSIIQEPVDVQCMPTPHRTVLRVVNPNNGAITTVTP